jgi:hypothetical protein
MDGRHEAYNERMSDFIFLGATLAFFAICALYVQWCDKIIGPDDFKSELGDAASDEATR